MSLPRVLHRAGDRFATLDQCKKSKQKKRQTYETHKYNFFHREQNRVEAKITVQTDNICAHNE